MQSRKQLLVSALTKTVARFFLIGLLLFLPAGTWNYPGAWRFIGLLFVPMLILGVVLLCKAPELLEKRLKVKEEQSEQKQVILFSGFDPCVWICSCSSGFPIRMDPASHLGRRVSLSVVSLLLRIVCTGSA